MSYILQPGKVLVVDENGIGYRPNFWDNVKEFFNKTISNEIVVKILIIVVALAIIFVCILLIRRGWRISQKISDSIISAPKKLTISESKNAHELQEIIHRMPEEIYELAEVKKLISKKLKELNRKHNISNISKEELLKELK